MYCNKRNRFDYRPNIPITEWEGIENKPHWISSVKFDWPWMQFLQSSSPPSCRNNELLFNSRKLSVICIQATYGGSKNDTKEFSYLSTSILLDKLLKYSLFLVRKHVTKNSHVFVFENTRKRSHVSRGVFRLFSLAPFLSESKLIACTLS